jgi:hypothetical protein
MQGGSGMTTTPAIPLEERICIDLMKAGITGQNGTHPLCLGERCLMFEICKSLILDAQKKLKELEK